MKTEKPHGSRRRLRIVTFAMAAAEAEPEEAEPEAAEPEPAEAEPEEAEPEEAEPERKQEEAPRQAIRRRLPHTGGWHRRPARRSP